MAYSQKKKRSRQQGLLRIFIIAVVLLCSSFIFIRLFIGEQRKSRATDTAEIELKLSLKFQGIVSEPAESNSMSVKVIAVDSEGTAYDAIGTFTADNSRVWNGTATFEGVPGDDYTIYIKGPKHIQKRICEDTPVESGPGEYGCSNGGITLVEGENELDFTGIYLFGGDLPSQDGVSNSSDIAYIYNNLGKTEDAVLTKADLNLDGVIDTQDYSLVTFALGIQSEDDEPDVDVTPTPTPTINPSITVTPTPTSHPGTGEAFELGPGGRWSSVAVDSQGKAHYAWWSQQNHAIRYIKCGQSKSSCTTEEKVNTGTNLAYYPAIALSTEDKPFLVWEERPDSSDDFEVYFSKRGSDGWSQPKKLSGDIRSELPQIATSDGNTIHAIYQATGRVLYYTKSVNGGDTWSTPEMLGHGLHARIVLDSNGLLHMTWYNTDPDAIYYRYQTSTSVWSEPITIYTGTKAQTADLSIDSQGTTHIVWSDVPSQYELSYTTVSASGNKAAIQNDIIPSLPFAMWPKLSVNADGTVVIVFQGKNGSNDPWNIYRLDRTTSGWGALKAITHESSSTQQTPDVSLRDGRGAMIYIDGDNIAWALPFNL